MSNFIRQKNTILIFVSFSGLKKYFEVILTNILIKDIKDSLEFKK